MSDATYPEQPDSAAGGDNAAALGIDAAALAAESPREQARRVLASGKPREAIRGELTQLREAEVMQCMHDAAVMDASPFWREVALRRYLLQKEPSDGR